MYANKDALHPTTSSFQALISLGGWQIGRHTRTARERVDFHVSREPFSPRGVLIRRKGVVWGGFLGGWVLHVRRPVGIITLSRFHADKYYSRNESTCGKERYNNNNMHTRGHVSLRVPIRLRNL